MTAARPLSAGSLGRPGLARARARCWVAAGPRHGRQQFLKQEFSWKNRETFALLSMRSSLAAARPAASLGRDWHAFLLCPPGRQTAVTRLKAAVPVRQTTQFVTVTGGGGAARGALTERLLAAAQARPPARHHYLHYRGATQSPCRRLPAAVASIHCQVVKFKLLRCSRSSGRNRDARDHHDDSVTDKLTCADK